MKNEWKVLDINEDLLKSKEFEDFGGIEELTNYEIVSEKSEARKREKQKNPKSTKKKGKVTHSKESSVASESKSEEIDMSAWCNCFLPDSVLQALRDLSFYLPTPIQKLVIPAAIRDRKDILGAAETGSGKTLAFGIPLVSGILSMKERTREDEEKPLYSLILTPTRELAIQIKQHLKAICKYTDIMVAVIVGGISVEKQRRILRKCPDIVVGTPGRLWELIDEGEAHLQKIPTVKHLVIDEADRMVEKGHFAELTLIMNLMNGKTRKKRQNMVMSATLTLCHKAPERLLFKKRKLEEETKLNSLINLIGMENAVVVDITQKTAVVESLTETQIVCSLKDKDAYLYYFLTQNPGRTLVFCNSIDCVRRLRSVLELLNIQPLPLHASMHQKQRLKNLEKFTASQTAVLLATDVAARGLDIRGIEHVIHFQVPRTAETYVHRSGRTARAQNEGLSLILIEPQEATLYKRMCKTLKKDKALQSFSVENDIFRLVRGRVQLAKEIDILEHRTKKLTAQNRWFIKAAEEMDVDIEEENLLNHLGSSQEQASKSHLLNNMKKQLKKMLLKPIRRYRHGAIKV